MVQAGRPFQRGSPIGWTGWVWEPPSLNPREDGRATRCPEDTLARLEVHEVALSQSRQQVLQQAEQGRWVKRRPSAAEPVKDILRARMGWAGLGWGRA